MAASCAALNPRNRDGRWSMATSFQATSMLARGLHEAVTVGAVAAQPAPIILDVGATNAA